MTNKELFDIYNVLLSLNNVKAGAKFHYSRILNIKKIKPVFDSFSEAFKPSTDYIEFEEARKNVLLESASRDENNEIIWEIKDKLPKFNDLMSVKQKVTELEEKYSQAILSFSILTDEVNKFLAEEAIIELEQFDLNMLPDMDGTYIDILFTLIRKET